MTTATPHATRSAILSRYALPVSVIGLCLLAVFVWLYQAHHDAYTSVLTLWMGAPFGFPFLDLASIPAWIVCWQHGIDVYQRLPCDVLGGIFDYSPLWLRLSFIPTDPAMTPWLGLGQSILVILALGALPWPHSVWDRVLVVVGTFSSLPVFGLERGNVDMIMFVLAVIAALCLGRHFAARVVGYAVILLAGLLKFYPCVMLLLLLRERLRMAIVLGLVAFVVLVAFVWRYQDELIRSLHNIPYGGEFGDTWGAPILPIGITSALPLVIAAFHLGSGWFDPVALATVLNAVLELLLIACSLLGAILIAVRQDFRVTLATLPDWAYVFLLIGATLVCGCFFSGLNVGYRGIHLLFVLPCLLALTRGAESVGAARIFRFAAYATLYVLWMSTIRFGIARLFDVPPLPVHHINVIMVAWLIRELIWWWLVTVLLAIVLRFVLDSPALGELLEMTRPATKPSLR